MFASALMLVVIVGCAKEWREDADRTYQLQMEACREFGCSQEEIEAINKWYRDTKSAILAYELAENAEDRKTARDIILNLLPKIQIKVGNEDSSDSENIQDDDVEVSLDLIAAADIAAMPSGDSTPTGQEESLNKPQHTTSGLNPSVVSQESRRLPAGAPLRAASVAGSARFHAAGRRHGDPRLRLRLRLHAVNSNAKSNSFRDRPRYRTRR